jgi:hypothetical protein
VLGHFCNFQILVIINYHPIGKNSSNLVTLSANRTARDHDRRIISIWCQQRAASNGTFFVHCSTWIVRSKCQKYDGVLPLKVTPNLLKMSVRQSRLARFWKTIVPLLMVVTSSGTSISPGAGSSPREAGKEKKYQHFCNFKFIFVRFSFF